MATEAEITITFIFRRSGKQELKLSELYLPLSMELGWFSPHEAKDFVKMAIKQKLLREEKDLVKPNFNIEQITVPLGFRPSKQVLETNVTDAVKEGRNLFAILVESICKKTDLDEEIIIEKIKLMEQEKNITPEIAALLVGKEHNVVLEEFYQEIKKQI